MPLSFFMGGWPFLSLLLHDEISISSPISLWQSFKEFGFSLPAAIVWRVPSGNVVLFLVGDVHSSHGVLFTNFCNLWPQGLNN